MRMSSMRKNRKKTMAAMKQPDSLMDDAPEPPDCRPARELAIAVMATTWERYLPSLEPRIQEALAVLVNYFPEPVGDLPVEISLTLMDDPEITQLNREFRQKDKPTNVLSFPQLDFCQPEMRLTVPEGMRLPLGDVMLSFTTIQQEAQAQHKQFLAHCLHLFTHGVLHLAGYDHEEEEDAEEMEAIEIEILAQLGIANPYAPVKEEAL